MFKMGNGFSDFNLVFFKFIVLQIFTSQLCSQSNFQYFSIGLFRQIVEFILKFKIEFIQNEI
jgi:hypothetical protein